MRTIFLLIATLIFIVSCHSGHNDWVAYDAEYVAAELFSNNGVGNHYGWSDPQPEHGNDAENGHKGQWCKWWKRWVEERSGNKAVIELPAYFILRNSSLPTIYVDAESLMTLRSELTVEGGLVFLHPADNVLVYPGFLFVNDEIDIARFVEWMAEE